MADKDPWDIFLKYGSQCDLITPVMGMLNDVLNGPPAHFLSLSLYPQWGKRGIKKFLKDRGIKAWGFNLNFSGDNWMFTVNIADAQQAYELMDKAGVPLTHIPKSVAPKPEPSRQIFDIVFDNPKCPFCGSFDLRNGRCYNCGGIR